MKNLDISSRKWSFSRLTNFWSCLAFHRSAKQLQTGGSFTVRSISAEFYCDISQNISSSVILSHNCRLTLNTAECRREKISNCSCHGESRHKCCHFLTREDCNFSVAVSGILQKLAPRLCLCSETEPRI